MDMAEKIIHIESVSAKVIADTTVCENKTISLFASGGTKYQWSPATGLDNPTSATPTVTIDKTKEYSVTISTANGCSVTKKVTVHVDENEDFVAQSGLTACAGTPVTLTVSGEASEYHWTGDSTLSATTGKSVTVSPAQTTTYTIEGIYSEGCHPKRQINVTVDKAHAPVFEIVRSGGECNKPVKYSMLNKTANAQRYDWNLGASGGITTTNIDDYIYETPGKYVVTLTSFNTSGCALSVSRELVAEPALVIANVITPNGDGKNDTFVIPMPGSSLEVYNRWGKSIFKTTNYKDDWGKGVANGTYFYVVDTPGGNHCKGWFEVLE
jgi:gliding motility-associated-like protein